MSKHVQLLANIGTNDYSRLELQYDHEYLDGQVVDVPDRTAELLIANGLAREWTPEVQQAVAERDAKLREELVKQAMPEAQRQVALDAAKAEAAKRAAAPKAHLTPAAVTTEHPAAMHSEPSDVKKK
jgi:hypothetical protein